MIFSAHSVTYLDLSGNSIREISPELYQLTNLEELDLSDNQIHKIHVDGILKLTNLKKLNLENNLLTEIPCLLSSLPLTNLNICENLIVSPYSCPTRSLEMNLVHVEYIDKYSKFYPYDTIPFTRLFILGESDSCTLSECHFIIFLLYISLRVIVNY